ncbi:hypothetical protein [Undibacterium umbellatum]|uniref:Uncharacterized protein n=1 Tax=Undibacterium umbellatum TaxID=2762300 RepID=A0ABR6Z373_9BURK|nr:hypothetical protein [Undibacterium umbellatum]MBC3906231.1 hypothetical protein [Undibacterium umbellatum]
MQNIDQIRNDLQFTIGRVNGIHMLLLTIARALPHDVAAACVNELTLSVERAEADLLALPIADIAIQENIRVVREGIFVLSKAAQEIR